jgi:4-hydroxy-3-methylbut-2-en-1-yl diphosphate reductase
MNRTLRLQQLHVSNARPGKIVVATQFDHPARGPVRCDAAALLAAALQAEGAPDVCLAPAQVRDGADGVMFTASYTGPSAGARGFGICAHRDDAAGLSRAEQAVASWAGAMRSRRLMIAAADPSCPGERRARDLTVGAYLPRPDLDQIPDGAIIGFPAAGAALSVQIEAAARGLDVIDATCPLVAAAHADIRAYAGRGDTVILIGQPGHAAFATFTQQGAESLIPVASVADVEKIADLDQDRVSFVVQTGLPVERALPLIAALRARFPRLRGHHFDVLCYAASDRIETVRAVAMASDLLLVLGSDADQDCRDLVAAAGTGPADAQVLDDLGQLRPDVLAAAGAVGLAVARSAPEGLAGQVRDALSGLGPLSTVTRRVSTEALIAEPALRT